jgi:hypothetical protein
MGNHVRWLAGLWMASVIAGCGADETSTAASEGGGPSRPAPLAPESVSVLAFVEGAPTKLDPLTLEARGVVGFPVEAARIGLGQPLSTPSSAALLGFDEEESGATIWFSQADGARELGTFSGALGASVLPFGCLVFASDQGERWAFAKSAGGFAQSKPCPRPTSLRAVSIGGAGATVEAVGPDADGVMSSIAVRVDDGVLASCEWTPLEVSASVDARLVEIASPSSRAIVDLVAGELVVTPLDGMRGGGAARVPATSAHLESAVAISDDEDGETTIFALASSPSVLHAVRVAPSGDGVGLVVSASTSVDLEGAPARADRVPSSDLALAGDRIFVTTSSGLRVFTTNAAPFGVTLVTSRADVTGPIALVAAD